VIAKIQIEIDGILKVITANGTGSILSNNIVITVAHVLYFKDYNKWATDIKFYPAQQRY